MNVNRCFRIACACFALVAVGMAQSGPAAPGQDRVRNGVSRQYEQSDPYPVYETHTIQVGNGEPYYDPPEITIHAGDLIQWKNKRLSDAHTIIDTAGSFESSPIPAEKNFCYHFLREGDYVYSCRFHPWMKGTVHVRLRELPITPASPDSAETRSAGFLLSNLGAIETEDGYWMPGTAPGVLLHRVSVRGPVSAIRISGIAQRLVPLTETTSGQLLAAGPGLVYLIDPKLKTVDEKIALPKNFAASRAVHVSAKQFWLSNSQGNAFVFADLEKKVTRFRALPAGSHIIAMHQQSEQAWALDSGRGALLKLGTEWATEVALPEQVKTPRSLAVDSDGRPWFLDPVAGIAGFVQANGLLQQFSVRKGQGAELLRASGSRGLFLTDRATKRVWLVDAQGTLASQEIERAAECADPRAGGPIAAIENKESK